MKTGRRGAIRGRSTCVLIDDHEAVLSALASMLGDEGHDVVGVAGTGAAALRLLDEHRPQFAVLDSRLPDMSGLEVARASADLGSVTAMIIYMAECEPTLVEQALAAGVRGVVLKDASPTRLLEAIEAALAGEVYVDPALGGGAPSSSHPAPGEDLLPRRTPADGG